LRAQRSGARNQKDKVESGKKLLKKLEHLPTKKPLIAERFSILLI